MKIQLVTLRNDRFIVFFLITLFYVATKPVSSYAPIGARWCSEADTSKPMQRLKDVIKTFPLASSSSRGKHYGSDIIQSTTSSTLLLSKPTSASDGTNTIRRQNQFQTLLRVSVPSILAGILATLLFPGLSLFLASHITNPGTFTVLSQDSSQFVQNFLSVASLLFSILVGQTCKLYCTFV